MPVAEVDKDSPCPRFQPRETPLLVDELAAAVEELMIPRHTSERRAVGHDLGRAALARYKQEVGDDPR